MTRAAPAALALLLIGAAPPPAAGVEYAITPVTGANGLAAIDVSLRFAGDADGTTVVELPNAWAGSDKLYEAIGDLTAEGGRIAAGGAPDKRRIDHAPGAPITMRYRIAKLSAADPAVEYEKARPVLRPNFFYVHGEGALATLEGRLAEPARFRWGAAPAGWRTASSLDSTPRLTVNDAAQGVFIGGTDLRIASREVGGQKVTTVLRGRFPYSDVEFADALAKVITASNTYWQAPAVPYFVPMIPLTGWETGAMSYGGTGRTGGFALAATPNVPMADIVRLLAHEYGHRWLGGSLGPLAKPDAAEYWFTEGFNDFVTNAVLVRAGLRDEKAAAQALNDLFLRYASSPARTKPYAALAESFWQDGDAQQQVYDRGNMLALALDGQASVRAALVQMAQHPGRFAPGETQAGRFLRVFPALTPARRDAMLAGTPVDLLGNLFYACGPLRWQEQPRYESGYSAEEKDGVLRFAKVDTASPAWAAGLRPGMRYVRRESFKYGDARVPIVMRVADERGERVLSWLPRSEERVRFQQFELKPKAGGACRKRLSGN